MYGEPLFAAFCVLTKRKIYFKVIYVRSSKTFRTALQLSDVDYITIVAEKASVGLPAKTLVN